MDSRYIFIDNKYYTSYNEGNRNMIGINSVRNYFVDMQVTDGASSGKYLEGIPRYGAIQGNKGNFYIMGQQKLFTYLYLNEEEAAQIDIVKITTSWEIR